VLIECEALAFRHPFTDAREAGQVWIVGIWPDVGERHQSARVAPSGVEHIGIVETTQPRVAPTKGQHHADGHAGPIHRRYQVFRRGDLRRRGTVQGSEPGITPDEWFAFKRYLRREDVGVGINDADGPGNRCH